jgi:hypothetical protein
VIPTITEAQPEAPSTDHRRPGPLDLAAGLLLLATVGLHVVALFFTYFAGTGSLASQTQQAALYAVLTASWALALVVGLTGPHRTPVAAGLAVGITVTELGFRVSDAGDAIRYGTGQTGLWLMSAAWVVGAGASVVAVLAARARHSGASRRDAPGRPDETAGDEVNWDIDWAAPVTNPYTGETEPAPVASPRPPDEPVAADATPAEDPHERMAWTLLVVILAAIVAGAFLPPWDHGVALSVASGRAITRNLGNAFDAPWQEVLGSVLTALALLAVPIFAIRMRNRAAGAALAIGALLVLASQFVAAIVQVDDPASTFGISPAQARNLGLELSLRLTGWFTVDALAAYALFATVMVWATLRHPDQENSAGTPPSTP